MSSLQWMLNSCFQHQRLKEKIIKIQTAALEKTDCNSLVIILYIQSRFWSKIASSIGRILTDRKVPPLTFKSTASFCVCVCVCVCVRVCVCVYRGVRITWEAFIFQNTNKKTTFLTLQFCLLKEWEAGQMVKNWNIFENILWIIQKLITSSLCLELLL